jgi:hypothetical protein
MANRLDSLATCRRGSRWRKSGVSAEYGISHDRDAVRYTGFFLARAGFKSHGWELQAVAGKSTPFSTECPCLGVERLLDELQSGAKYGRVQKRVRNRCAQHPPGRSGIGPRPFLYQTVFCS